MNINAQAQQNSSIKNTAPILQTTNLTNLTTPQNNTITINANEPKTVFDSVFNLGQKLITTGKAKFSDYASAAFDVAKGFLKESSWLKNSSSVLARAASSALEADTCLLYTSPSPRDRTRSRMPSSA